MFRNETMSVVCSVQRRLQNEMKESTYIAHNEFEAMSVGFVLCQFAKRRIIVRYFASDIIPAVHNFGHASSNMPTYMTNISHIWLNSVL